jgi:hypothetical protein
MKGLETENKLMEKPFKLVPKRINQLQKSKDR